MLNLEMLKDKKVTVMGLGLHGGGLASARFFAEAGARVTVTDLGDPEKLQSSVDKLSDLQITFVLGQHREIDFTDADIVIKNPAVPSSSKYLKMAKHIETDISTFLQLCNNKIIAVTGSKGKSTTVSAVFHVLKKVYPGTRLGGNITVSPLTFINQLKKDDPVILELSSWQLADLSESGLLKPKISVITNIMNDHQNKYNSFEEYVYDKKQIYKNQDSSDFSIFSNDAYGRVFQSESKGNIYTFNDEKPQEKNLNKKAWFEDSIGYFSEDGVKIEEIVPRSLLVPGEHFRINMLISAMILKKYGLDNKIIRSGLETFQGVTHRMEKFAEKQGILFYNDSAATIPEATVAAVKSFQKPVHLITGGTDKKLDFSILSEILNIPRGLYLLEGSGTDKLIKILKRDNQKWHGPYSTLKEALDDSVRNAKEGDSIILSPGCASFGMFLNEFDRGDKFKELVQNL
ncbi:MAG: UDP-N-acetylmuramoyl-L-alanine--D-glutamate ligase [Spirochaetaceae bacterium]|nr:UDP-N-acetylmuramoyl-L-alanine--D-glutamate ligase [Spirochaetaceae bacterium]